MERGFEPTRVLCAVDLAEPSAGLIDTATSLAMRFRAHLHLLHVWAPWVPAGPEASFVPLGARIESMATELKVVLEGAVRTAQRAYADVDGSLVPGRPWEEIVSFAEINDYDLIVAGTHGRTGIARLVTGSVAERVVRESSVPVLVVPIARSAVTVGIGSARFSSSEAASSGGESS
jgi:nucleotide-binding universal stress UspA family protein